MAANRMTEGSIHKHLIGYSLPLIGGSLFQLAYNMVDSIIVGRFIGKEALAAIGTSGPVLNILILGISGICIGASVLMSTFFGAKDYIKLKKELSTTVIIGFIASIIISLLGMAVARPLLWLLRVPENILDMAVRYLTITFLGVPFTFLYNSLSAAIKSVGNSKVPFNFLVIASILNGVLDVILIGFLGYGVVVSALTTVLAQFVSVVMCIAYIYAKVPMLAISKSEFKVDKELLNQTLKYGGVTALQQSCQPIGKLLIQGAVNSMGVDAMAAFNIATKLDDFAFTPEQSISHGMTTFIAQNRGAKLINRIKGGCKTGFMLEGIYGVFICLAVILLREPILRLFGASSGTDVMIMGSEYLFIMAFFYILPAFTNGMQGYFRGMGILKVTLYGTIIQTSLRVIFTYILTPYMGLTGVAYACAIGWIVMLMFGYCYNKKMVRLAD
jgi:putative efflux protein, MATE family